MNKVKYLICYHNNCIDGFTSAWAARKGLMYRKAISPALIDTIAVDHWDIDWILSNEFTDYTEVYFVDFSVPITHLNYISSRVDYIHVLDHHKIAYDTYKEYGFDVEKNPVMSGGIGNICIALDLYESGASLVWKYFYGGSGKYLPYFIQLVKDYDLYKFKLPDTKNINMYLRVLPKTFSDWEYVYGELSDPLTAPNIVTRGEAIIDYHNMIVETLIERAEPCDLDGNIGLVVNAPHEFRDDICNTLALKSGTYGAIWSQFPNNNIKWSLRSNGMYDVDKIARRFGGGGHKNAAAFTLHNPINPTTPDKKGVTLWSNVQD